MTFLLVSWSPGRKIDMVCSQTTHFPQLTELLNIAIFKIGFFYEKIGLGRRRGVNLPIKAVMKVQSEGVAIPVDS